jgi:5S rRNA maturation endonuclease (ribonuclease M5)
VSAIIDQRRQSRTALTDALRDAGAEFRGNAIACPFHEDRTPSGGIFRGDDGAWRFQCHSVGCSFHGDVFDVIARASHRDVADVLRETNEREKPVERQAKRVFPSVDSIRQSVSKLGEVEACYCYADPDTRAVEVVQVRYIDDGKKRFLTHRAVEGGFVLGAPPKPWPIYNRSRLAGADVVMVVEGEKCVHALHGIGIVATTSLSGAENAGKADWTPLAGKRVFIWPDNDDAGRKYAVDVARMLAHMAVTEVNVVATDGLDLPEHGDVADLIAGGATAEDLWHIVNDGSEPVGAGADLALRVSGIISGEYRSLDWPWPALSRSAMTLFPATITVLCGDPAASKSFFLLQAAHWWHANGTSVALMEMEDDRAHHLHRLLAVIAGKWCLLDDKWCRANPDLLAQTYADHRSLIDEFAPRLHSAPMGMVRYAEVLEWMRAECAKGTEVLCIDPITAVHTGENRQIEDLKFINDASALLREAGARLVLVTHPRGATKGRPTQDDMAGGRAFSRHTQSVLWLHRHDPPKPYRCTTPFGDAYYECNRSVHIAKARNAPGHGWTIGFHLGDDAKFAERGVVVKVESAA